jgi:hypothetical protein
MEDPTDHPFNSRYYSDVVRTSSHYSSTTVVVDNNHHTLLLLQQQHLPSNLGTTTIEIYVDIIPIMVWLGIY